MPAYLFGDEHAVKAAVSGSWSSAHSNVAASWFEANVNVASVLSDSVAGPVSTQVSGGTRIVHAYSAGVGSTVLVQSFARTRNTCSPVARSGSGVGDEHDWNSAPSREHSKSMSATGVRSSVPVNSNVPGGWATITVSGGRPTVHVWLAGESSPTARTSKVCGPSASPTR
jgi:hypothetical protein